MRYLAGLERYVAAEISRHFPHEERQTSQEVTLQVESNFHWSATQRFSVAASAHDVLEVLWSRKWLKDNEQWKLLKWVDEDTGMGIDRFPGSRFSTADRSSLVARRSIGAGQLLWIGASDPNGLDLERDYSSQDTMFYLIQSERDGHCSVMFRWCIDPEVFPIVLPDNVRTKFMALEASTRNLRLTRLAEEAAASRSPRRNLDVSRKAERSSSIQSLVEPLFDQVVVTNPRDDARVELNQLGWEILLMSLRLEEESESERRRGRSSPPGDRGSGSDSDRRAAGWKRRNEELEPEGPEACRARLSRGPRGNAAQQPLRDLTPQVQVPWLELSAPERRHVTPQAADETRDGSQPDPSRDWQDDFWRRDEDRAHSRDQSRGESSNKLPASRHEDVQQQWGSCSGSHGRPEPHHSLDPLDPRHVTHHPPLSRDTNSKRRCSRDDDPFRPGLSPDHPRSRSRDVLPPIMDLPHLNDHPNPQKNVPPRLPPPPLSAPFLQPIIDQSCVNWTAKLDRVESLTHLSEQAARASTSTPPPALRSRHHDPFLLPSRAELPVQHSPPLHDATNPSRASPFPSCERLPRHSPPGPELINPNRTLSRDPPFQSPEPLALHSPSWLGTSNPSQSKPRDLPFQSRERPHQQSPPHQEASNSWMLSREPLTQSRELLFQSRDLPFQSREPLAQNSPSPPGASNRSQTPSHDSPFQSRDTPVGLSQFCTQSRDLPDKYTPAASHCHVTSLSPSFLRPPCYALPASHPSIGTPCLTYSSPSAARQDQPHHLPHHPKLASPPSDYAPSSHKSRDVTWPPEDLQHPMPYPTTQPANSVSSAGNLCPSLPIGQPTQTTLSGPAVQRHPTMDGQAEPGRSHVSDTPTLSRSDFLEGTASRDVHPAPTRDRQAAPAKARTPSAGTCSIAASTETTAGTGAVGVGVEQARLALPRLAKKAVPTLAVPVTTVGGAVPMSMVFDPTEYFRALAEMQMLLQTEWMPRKRRGRPRYSPVVIKPKIMKIAPATGSPDSDFADGCPNPEAPKAAIQAST